MSGSEEPVQVERLMSPVKAADAEVDDSYTPSIQGKGGDVERFVQLGDGARGQRDGSSHDDPSETGRCDGHHIK